MKTTHVWTVLDKTKNRIYLDWILDKFKNPNTQAAAMLKRFPGRTTKWATKSFWKGLES